MKQIGKKRLAAAAVTAAVVVVFAALLIRSRQGQENMEITQLKRPGYGEGDYVYTLRARYGGDTYTVTAPVSAKKLEGAELQAAFDSAFEIICARMPGKNPSLEEVRSNLVFISSIPEYGMTVDYTLKDYSVINSFGDVNNEDAEQGGEIHTVYAQLTYDGLSQTYEIPVTVYAPEYSDEELMINKIGEELAKTNNAGMDQDMQLPRTIDGQEITFSKQPESKAYLILLPGLAAFAFWYYKRFIVRKKADGAREEQLRADYSEIVSKLSLLMGAGMSSANAFARISRDYTAAKQGRRQPARCGYEEITAVSNRIASGVSEAEAYAAFGRACRIHSYIKLASLLTQNVVKGAEGFNAMLRNEVTEAFAERKALARIKGEEAGTKLLLPMIMMLGVVLVMIVVPAFMSF